MKKHWVNPNCQNSEPTKRAVSISANIRYLRKYRGNKIYWFPGFSIGFCVGICIQRKVDSSSLKIFSVLNFLICRIYSNYRSILRFLVGFQTLKGGFLRDFEIDFRAVFALQRNECHALFKGQLISEWLLDHLNFPKKQLKDWINFCLRI